MKKLLSLVLVSLCGIFCFADEWEQLDPNTGFPIIKNVPFVMFNEGVTFNQVTRIEEETKRSNFVRETYMIGGFFEIETQNLKPFDGVIRLAAYYPYYNTFNGMQQFPKQLLLYAVDMYAGPVFQFDMWKYVGINLSFGGHYMYQLTDEYHMSYLGIGGKGGIELPVARRWTILIDGMMTVDYANLGTNKNIQPFDWSWDYQADIGVRYSRKGFNKYSYIHDNPEKKEAEKLIQKAQKKEAKEAAADKEEKKE